MNRIYNKKIAINTKTRTTPADPQTINFPKNEYVFFCSEMSIIFTVIYFLIYNLTALFLYNFYYKN